MFDFVAISLFIFIALNIIFYVGIWIKIKNISKGLNISKDTFQTIGGKTVRVSEKKNQYQNTAKLLILFVVAYTAQWWPFFIYSVWYYIAIPHIYLAVCITIFANMGGLFNFLAYTLIRKKLATEKTRKYRDSEPKN